jgi:GxxExxY protein
MEPLCQQIVDAAELVHSHLGGPGLLETVYECALCHELALKGVRYKRQVAVPVLYRGVVIREPLFLDILVEDTLVVEVKATERDFPFYQAQLLTYLKLTGVPLGLLVNFGKLRLTEGVTRIHV